MNPGDGARYKGRGANMQTFECNCAAAEVHAGVPFVAHPELMAEPGLSLVLACYYWQARDCWDCADRSDLTGWRHLTNGGMTELGDFTARTKRLLQVLA